MIKINETQYFFETYTSPNREWNTFSTCSRCAGFTLAYGGFYNIDIDKFGLDNKIPDYEDTEDFQKIRMTIKYLNDKYPHFTFSRMPCCWPNETGYNLFVGFNVYPFVWTKANNRYLQNMLVSNIDYHMNDDNDKNTLISQIDYFYDGKYMKKPTKPINEYTQYKLTDHMQKTVAKIFEEYSVNHAQWSDSLYIDKYACLYDWSKILNEMYDDKIKKFNEDITKIYELGNLITFQWSFIPSDCASCS